MNPYCPKDGRRVIPKRIDGVDRCPNCDGPVIQPTPALEKVEELLDNGDVSEPRIRHQSARSYRWRLVLFGIVLSLAVASISSLMDGLRDVRADFAPTFILIRLGGIALALVVAGLLLPAKQIRGEKRAQAKGAITRLREDPRPPVVYLRPFSADHRFSSRLQPTSPEESMASVAENFGPFVAIGRPGEPEPDLGAHRIYVNDPRWKELATQFIKEARLVILQAGSSHGLLWELKTLLSLRDHTSFIIYFDPQDTKSHVEFCEASRDVLPHPIPEHNQRGGYLYFDADWKPHFEEELEVALLECLGQSKPGNSSAAREQRPRERAETLGVISYGGFGIRLAAKSIDGLLFAIPFIIWAVVMAFQRGAGQPSPLAQWLQIGMGMLFWVAYTTFCHGKYGATLGKMACGLKVVTHEGARVTYARGLARAFAEVVSHWICDIGYVIAVFDEQKRTLHDRIAGTRVIRIR